MNERISTGMLVLVIASTFLLVPVARNVVSRARQNVRWGDPAGRVVLSLGLVLVVSVVAGVIFAPGRSGMQVFAAYGSIKRLVLPITYLVFLVALVLPYRSRISRRRLPYWWHLLGSLLVVSTVLSLVVPRQDLGWSATAQGMTLIVGSMVVATIGAAAETWSAAQRSVLMWMLAGVSFFISVLYLPLGPLTAMNVPVAAGMIYAAIRSPRDRVALLITGASILLLAWGDLRTSVNASISIRAQMVVCSVLVVCSLLPRRPRLLLLLLGAAVALGGVVRSGILSLMTGDAGSFSDVSLIHRAYEAAVVWGAIASDAVSQVFGLGPGATVDLSGSPDRSTLFVSGRDLGAVDDVHFLTSWMLMKFGLMGLAWLLLFMVSCFRDCWAVLVSGRVDVFDLWLVLFVASGLVAALPAATNLFTNPLLMLFAATLHVRRRSNDAVPPVQAQVDRPPRRALGTR